MRRPFLFLPLAAAACATLTTPLPQSARLTPDSVTVTLTDSERCLGTRAGATDTGHGWSGKLSGCSQALPYEVRLDAHPNIFQGVMVEVFQAIGAKGLLAPGGEVLVTDARGVQHVFASPPPVPASHFGNE